MHRKSVANIYETLKTRANGLTQAEANERLKSHGPNLIEKRKKKPLIVSLLEEFTDLMVVILMIAAVIAIASGELKDGAVILFIVVLNAMIGFMQKFKAEKALEALQKMLSLNAKVMRDGVIQEIDATQLVPGDVLLLNEGDKVPADSRLIEVNELEADESALTGESVPVAKHSEAIDKKEIQIHEQANRIFMGTSITHGTAKAIVIETGMRTEFGKIANLTQTTTKDKSPLQKELFKIGLFAGKITVVISLILFGVVWLFQDKPFTETLLFATSVAVAAVPEGLPATITIALAIGVQRLAKKRAIVKKLASVETLGSTSVICSDKTGTLTKNEMTVIEAYTNGEVILIDGNGYRPEGKWAIEKNRLKNIEKFGEAVTLCNNSKMHFKDHHWGIIGDPTEGALLVAASKLHEGKADHFAKKFKRIHEFPFDSVRKMMTTLDKDSRGKTLTAHLKGAPDQVLKICTHVYENGKVVTLTAKKRNKIQEQNEAMANKALRVLALAYKDMGAAPKEKKTYHKESVEKGMVFLGLMGMIDPARSEVYEAVQMAKRAGIKIYMVTGDYGLTAAAIGRELKIVEGDNVEIISGEELNHWSEKKLAKTLREKDRQILFARVSPEHKLKIVKALKDNHETVAMTGDGVNDAPALKRADIGVAMGITGTDVSKEAADMILVDDSFGTIVTAISEGRTIYNNLKKFVFYMFSCNMGELVTILAAIAIGIPSPLTAILILTVNLGTDVLPALALGVDPTEDDIMDKKPRAHNDSILQKNFISHFLYLGILMGIMVVITYVVTLKNYGWEWGMDLAQEDPIYLKASSVAFVLLVVVQMVNAFNVRNLNGSILNRTLLSNKWLLAATSTSILLIFAFVEIDFFQHFLGTTHLTAKEWGMVFLVSLSLLAFEEIRKWGLGKKTAS